jgi:hypothetical protein
MVPHRRRLGYKGINDNNRNNATTGRTVMMAQKASANDPGPTTNPEPVPAFTVFKGLGLAGVTVPMIAKFCAVSPQTVNQWRPGQQRAPLGRVVFLTLLLSYMVDELVRTCDLWGPATKTRHLHMKSCLEGARQALIEQHSQNEGIQAGAFCQGERFFDQSKQGNATRNWSAEAAQRVALGADTTRLEL